MTRSAAHAARPCGAGRKPSTGRRKRSSRARRPRPAGPRRRVWIRRIAAIGALGCVLGAAYLLVLRDSSLVAVRDVRVVGISSAERAEVRGALADAARGMTTLHVREDELAASVRQYPEVESVSAHPRFPTGLTIEVTEREPVAVLDVDGRDLPVDGDGTVLAGLSVSGLNLPSLEASSEPSTKRLRDGALEQARVLGAAPTPLRPLIERSTEAGQGVRLRLADGITLAFGDGAHADAKWAAAARILADGELDGLEYIDLRAPERPAVGGVAASPGAA